MAAHIFKIWRIELRVMPSLLLPEAGNFVKANADGHICEG
jgi:hypothetical protein